VQSPDDDRPDTSPQDTSTARRSPVRGTDAPETTPSRETAGGTMEGMAVARAGIR
jgi:hypothetical protein